MLRLTNETLPRIAVAMIAAFAIAACGSAPTPPVAYAAPRGPGGHPSLEGVWQARNAANVDLQDHGGALGAPAGFGVIVDPKDGTIPYRPEALARKAANLKDRDERDPLSKCYLAGVPRTTYLPYPLEVFQTDKEVVLLSEYVHTWRWVPTTPLDRIPDYESWMGDPRGHWDGDTLVVETVGFNDQTWLDHAGNYHSDALKVVERFTRTGPDVVAYEATLDDPKVFTRPWTIRLPLYRHTDRTQLLEYECYLYAEDAGRAIIGKHPEVK